MKRNFKQLALAVAAAVALLVAPGAFAQQDYPNKPVKIIVGYPPGGGPDFAARTLGKKLTEILGQPFIVENRPGAGGTTATAYVAKMPADGYTLLLGTIGELVIAPYIYKNLQYNTAKDFTPISIIYSTPLLLVSNSSKLPPIRNIQDLIREAKARPGKIDVGTSGIGSIHHLTMEMFKYSAGLDMMHIPYKGSGQSITAILAGDVPILFTAVTGAGPHIATGKLNLLAVTSANRLPDYPDVPALSEILKDFDYTVDNGLLAPAGLPPEVLSKLSRAIKQAMESPDLVEAFRKNSSIARYTTPEEYAESIRRDLKKYERAVKFAKIPMVE